MSIIERQFTLMIEIELLERKLHDGIMCSTITDSDRVALERHIVFKEVELQALKIYAHMPLNDVDNWKEYL